MTREQIKSLFTIHTNGQDEWIRVDKRTYEKAIDKFCDAHEVELKAKDEKIYDLRGLLEIAYRDAISIGMAHQQDCKAKDERIAELEAKLKNMCAECECAKFADNAIKPSEMWKIHTMLKDNK